MRATLQNVNRLVTDNQESLHNSISSLEAFSKSLSNNSARIDSIMIGVETLMGTKDGQEGELQQAAKSFRELADNLDKRTAGLIIDGRRALADISRAVNNFDRNPTRVLFGSSDSDARTGAPAPAPNNPNDARAKAQR